MSEKARIRRGAPARGGGRRRPTVTQRRPATVQRKTKSGAVRALARMPVPLDKVRAWARRIAWIAAGAAVIALLVMLKVPQMVGVALGEGAGALGLSVKRVEISGIKHMDRLPVYAVALDQQTTAMPLLDLEAIRQKLLKFNWVADARVSRRLPDTLLVDIVERQPVAIWQYHQKLNLIDRDGRVLAPVDLAAMPDLPLLIGPDANHREAALANLLDAAPPLKPMIAGATWIGGRRWDLRFQSGETLSLPEGEAEARRALAKFQRMDQAARLLGQGFVRFDMRVPGKFFVRVTRDPGVGVRDLKAAAAAAPTASAQPAAGEPPTSAPADAI